jgi:hypothetical protein
MSMPAKTDEDYIRDWNKAVEDHREELARRQRLDDQMRQAGFATPAPKLEGGSK